MRQISDEIELAKSELGRKTAYDTQYNPEKLFAVTRAPRRAEIGVADTLPFHGHDIWNHYEVSWLNSKGKPTAAIAELVYDCASPRLIESKSMKLYFNSFNNTKFASVEEVKNRLSQDLGFKAGAPVQVTLILLDQFNKGEVVSGFAGISLDALDISCDEYHVNPELLVTEDSMVEETLQSDLLRSNCLVTGQPDWASVQITYQGKKINHGGLLRYIVSFREHTEFGEHCIERMFMDISKRCQPKHLTIRIVYTRRGGLDIHFVRSSSPISHDRQTTRLARQ